MNTYKGKANACGFSLVEVLVVIAVIGILSALILPQILDVREGSQEAVARQQQSELQTALGNWLVARSSESGGLAAARTVYNGTSGKLGLLENYLQPATYASLSGGNTVSSTALDAANAYLQFSDWPVSEHQPTVEWINK